MDREDHYYGEIFQCVHIDSTSLLSLTPSIVVLDAIMIVLGMYTLNIIHPWRFLYSHSSPTPSDSSEKVEDVPMKSIGE